MNEGISSHSPLFVPASAFAIGISAAGLVSFIPCSVAAASLLGAAALLLMRSLPSSLRLWAPIFYAAGFTAFFLYGPGAPSPAERLVNAGPVSITGEVARPPREKDGFTLVLLRPDRPVFFPPGRAGLVRLYVKGNGLGMEYGDVLTGVMELEEPGGFRNPDTFNWGSYAKSNGEVALARVKPEGLTRLGNRAWPLLKTIYGIRRELALLSGKSLSGDASALFRAMVLGDEDGVTQEMRDEFQASGTPHILAVSGSHVALLASLVFFLVNGMFFLLPHRLALRMSLHLDARKAAAAVSIPAALLYCLLSGAHVATVRSVIMITVFLASLLFDRQTKVLNSLALAALIALMWDPSALFDISFQLSYGFVLFMALTASFMRDKKAPGTSNNKLVGYLSRSAVMSVAAIAGTGPLAARQFNSFSWVFMPANLLAVSIAGFVSTPVGLLSCLVYAVHPSGTLPFPGVVEFAMDAFYGVVRFFASAPHSNLHPGAPGLVATVLFYGVIAGIFLIRVKPVRKGAAVMLAFAALSTASLAHTPQKEMKVTFIDVGHGDCSLVEFPDGETMLIDGGGSPLGMDPGRATVAPYLWNHGIRRLDYVVITHPHPDHFGGLFYILANFDVGELWEGGMVSDTDEYARLRGLVGARGIARRSFLVRGEIEEGGATVQVLHTSADYVDDAAQPLFRRENNRSLVLRIKYGDVSFLFTGDIQDEAGRGMVGMSLPLKSTVLKVPHHGGATSLDTGFAQAVGPEVAVISTGRSTPRNVTPAPRTVSVLESLGAKVLVTRRDGGVTVVTDGKSYRVSTYWDTVMRPAGSVQDEVLNWGKLITM
jgi:competence protein ComEC